MRPTDKEHDTFKRFIASTPVIGSVLPAMAQQRSIIERDIPGASRMTPEQGKR